MSRSGCGHCREEAERGGRNVTVTTGNRLPCWTAMRLQWAVASMEQDECVASNVMTAGTSVERGDATVTGGRVGGSQGRRSILALGLQCEFELRLFNSPYPMLAIC